MCDSLNSDWQDKGKSGTIALQIDIPDRWEGNVNVTTGSCLQSFGWVQEECGHSSMEQYNRGGQARFYMNWGNDPLIVQSPVLRCAEGKNLDR